ncbi:uncharacterized protein KIAA1143 homolog [Zerene cesonia]|uniref:uncharacterized protein KIAA1143 homolog n=1 Tax=Zerene cesonia TaxID=33412 RepID=UPI0018E4DF11|nr:uncharacterized protein KIAA1143 homolog [Zerene cesonia]XP_038214870.1 uncharacterized protein KIAA1143 homolog [Zerene cesonia]XP_038214871.1 uncharacterized protein KIAA1143 homolog [Zerene cesonia]XP_038214872.1 uncharacterized protein KIAA1143 homolog [Zerene cesonia]
MNRKRNVNFIKPDDPPFLKALKKQAGYDDRNHKFDELQNNEEDFVNDDDTELPQVVVLKKGDLTAEEAEVEKERIKKFESESKADLNQRVIFKKKRKVCEAGKKGVLEEKSKSKKTKQLLSFADEDEDD